MFRVSCEGGGKEKCELCVREGQRGRRSEPSAPCSTAAGIVAAYHRAHDMPVGHNRKVVKHFSVLKSSASREQMTDLQAFEDVGAVVEAGASGFKIEWSVRSDLMCRPSALWRKVHVEHVVSYP